MRALLSKSQKVSDWMVALGVDVDTDVIIELAEQGRRLRGRGKLA